MAETAHSFRKQPSEIKYKGLDFFNALEATEVVATGHEDTTVTATDKNGADVTSAVVNILKLEFEDSTVGDVTKTNAKMKVQLKAGTEELQPYKITFSMQTNSYNHFEDDIIMYIRDK